MSLSDVRTLMATGVPANLATLLNELISQSQEIDNRAGILFKSSDGQPDFALAITTVPTTDVPPLICQSFNMTYNIVPGYPGQATFPVGTPPNPVKIDSTKCCFRVGIEGIWHQISVDPDDDRYLFEWNADYTSPDGTFTNRPFFCQFDTVRDDVYMYHNVHRYRLFCGDWKNQRYDDAVDTYVDCQEGAMTVVRMTVGFGSSSLAAYGTPRMVVFGNSIYHQNDSPTYVFDAYGATPADNRAWLFRADSSAKSFILAIGKDDGSANTDIIKVVRNGMTVTRFGLPFGLSVYANNAAAITGGLAVGDLYRTGADPSVVCVVT